MKKISKIILVVLLLFLITSCRKKNENDGKNPIIPNICDHINTSWSITKNSTCTTLGSKSLICNDCHSVLTTASISFSEHIEKTILGYDATCESDGLSDGSICKICNSVLVEQQIIKQKGHNYKLDYEKSSDDLLVYYCTNCDKTKEEINNYGTLCDGEHEASEWNVITPATCSSLGLKQIVCVNCGIVLESKDIEKLEHTEELLEEVKPTCYNTGLTEGKKCSVCDEIIVEQKEIEKLEHDYKITNTVVPTETKDGLLTYTCEMCKNSYDEIIPATGRYDETSTTKINLINDGSYVVNNNGGVSINGNEILITLSGEYDFSGTLDDGYIIIRLSEEEKATINLKGINLTSTTNDPIFIESGDKVEISAKSETKNYIYDKRSISDADAVGGAIYSKIDLEIKGKGELYIESSYNNGIATTKDLEIKNVTLDVNVPNNALKGNDSLTIESGIIKAISSSKDALKTENTDISDKGNQRGIITINGGTIDLYSAFDGIDAAYNVIINDGKINIHTDKYSTYTGEIVVPTNDKVYLRVSSRTNLTRYNYYYSAKFILSDGSVIWKNGVQDTSQQSRYYKFDMPSNTEYMKFFVYSSSTNQGQESTYLYATDQIAINNNYDTYYIQSVSSSSKLISGSWTTYGSGNNMGGPGGPGGMGGGMNEGNSEKETYSCKGIKADNEIYINGGEINIESRDDAIHTNSDVQLADGSYGVANININGGMLNIYSDDDAIHADGSLTINGGNIVITNSYEGIEGKYIYFKNGNTQINSKDDAINAKSGLNFNGGIVYLNSGGDGIDSNSTINMTGGVVLAQGPSNGGNGVIDFDGSFSFSGGLLLAIGCNGMNQKPTAASGNTSTSKIVSTSTNSYVNVSVNGIIIATIKVTKSSQNYCVLAYNNSTYPNATVNVSTSTSNTLINDLYYVKE